MRAVPGSSSIGAGDELVPAAQLKKLKNHFKQKAGAAAKRKSNQMMLGNASSVLAHGSVKRAACALVLQNGGVRDNHGGD